MNQHWIAVAARLSPSATETDAQQKVVELQNELGPDVAYLNTRNYPRLSFDSSTPPPTSTEPLFLVYAGGPFNTLADAQKHCEIVSKHSGSCEAAQPDPA